MQAGKLRHRVELQRLAEGASPTDAKGYAVKNWSTIAEVWASVEQLSGREYMLASQASADVTARIRIRGRADLALTPKDRVKFGARLFDIRHVIDWGDRGVETQLMCAERL